jgi:hypothetical protein
VSLIVDVSPWRNDFIFGENSNKAASDAVKRLYCMSDGQALIQYPAMQMKLIKQAVQG